MDIEQINQVKGHSKQIWDAKYSPNGKMLATLSDEKEAYIWNTQAIIDLSCQKCVGRQQDADTHAHWLDVEHLLASWQREAPHCRRRWHTWMECTGMV
jgi:WD40 repeat protein